MFALICLIGIAQALSFGAAQLGPFEILNIPAGEPLPVLKDLGNDVYLELVPNTITVSPLAGLGPGDNETGPFIMFTAPVFNDSLTAGVIRVKQGDNIFINLFPGQCGEYRMPISPISSPGMYWVHPHQHGSAVNQLNTANLPLAMLLAVNLDGWGPGPENDHTGPTDDGMISTAVGAYPGDPYCCKGPTPIPGDAEGGMWNDTGDANGTGADLGVSNSILPFYTSGADAEFALLNGAYQPTIAMEAGRAYLFRFVDAITMKILDLTITGSSCQMGIVNRDSIPLRELPRMTDHIFMGPANRVDALVQCNTPGNFSLQTGFGPQQIDPNCTSTHCELITQSVLATLVVSEASSSKQGITIEEIGMCQTTYPSYLADLRDNATTLSKERQSLQMIATNPALAVTNLNLSNPSPGNGESGACAINDILYNDQPGFSEVIGVTQEINISWIAVHPFHHHVQPFQLVQMVNPYGEVSNGTWQEGDWLDTLLLPNLANQAVIRWTSGPEEITGQGYFLMHCHIIPHSDQGCALKSQIVAQPTPMGGIAPITDDAQSGAEAA
ncbi:hypothetical protein WJX73_009450 [Symbiochloris irregularis]|uniref:Laccase n=1 Tax=Symbiochloris irregularis TaxID=706552 RepID=A0AAW1NU40_9CHLO